MHRSHKGVHGTVLDEAGVPLEGVVLLPVGGKPGIAYLGALSDSSGKFVIADIAPSHHSICAECAGFEGAIVPIAPDLRITLRRLGGATQGSLPAHPW